MSLSELKIHFPRLVFSVMIANIQEQEIKEVEKKSHEEESFNEKSSIDLDHGDEALRLIGAERTAQFSEEYNEKLKRKLVHSTFPYLLDIYIANYYLCTRIF